MSATTRSVDLLTRYKTMRGFNVLSPMGWDSFGLPAENAAIDMGAPPKANTEAQIVTMTQQIKQLGAMYDWDRELASHHPDYYRWDQWLFLQLWDRGLAYKKEAPVNWCPRDQTVLANEQVVEGACERCGDDRREAEPGPVVLQDHRLRRSAARPTSSISTSGRIGCGPCSATGSAAPRAPGSASKSMGGDLSFEVFTTRPDTIFGMTFCVLAPEHPLVEELIAGGAGEEEARAYIARATRASEIERMAEGEKTGVFTGAYAINPVNGQRSRSTSPTTCSWATGPGRSWRSPARTSGTGTSRPNTGSTSSGPWSRRPTGTGEAYVGDGPTINSGFLDGLDQAEAKAAIIEWLEERGIGEGTIQYRLRDWLISRQRYWGCPIPMIDCPTCGLVPVPDDQLAGAATRGRGLRPQGAVAARHARGLGAHHLSLLWRRSPTGDRHDGHLRRLVVVLLSIHRPPQRPRRIRAGEGPLLDGCRPVHRRGRARHPPSALRPVHHQVPLRHRAELGRPSHSHACSLRG